MSAQKCKNGQHDGIWASDHYECTRCGITVVGLIRWDEVEDTIRYDEEMRPPIEKLSTRLKKELEDRLKMANYMKDLRNKAIADTESRNRTNNIYDPEYCAFNEGYNRGWAMALDSAEQHMTPDGGYYDDPSLIERIAALETAKVDALMGVRVWLVEENEWFKHDKNRSNDISRKMAYYNWIKANEWTIKKIDNDLQEFETKP